MKTLNQDTPPNNVPTDERVAVRHRSARKDRAAIFLVVVISLLISVNLAWLNPWHQDSWFRPLCAISSDVPLLWQYDYDAPHELRMAAQFPDFGAVPSRTNRPLYYGVVHAMGAVVGVVGGAIVPSIGRHRYELAFILANTLLAIVYGFVGYQLLVRTIDRQSALLAVCLALTSFFSIQAIGTYHTYLFQLLTPAAILFLFSELALSYSHCRNILFSFLIGLLMMAKPTYGVYIAVLCFAALRGRWKESLLSLVAHGIPMALWFWTLKLLSLPYCNSEISDYGQGVWIFRDFIHMPVPKMAIVFVGWLVKYAICALGFYSIWLATVWVGFRRLREEGPARDPRGLPLLLAWLLFWNWAQMFAAVRYQGYMTADLSIPVFGLAAYGIRYEIDRAGLRAKWVGLAVAILMMAWFGVKALYLPIIRPFNASPLLILPVGVVACVVAVATAGKRLPAAIVLSALFSLWVLWNVTTLVEFPWISPAAQWVASHGR